jgi:hypothetical protein
MNALICFAEAFIAVDLFLKTPEFLSESKVLEFNGFVEDLGESVTLVVVVDSDINRLRSLRIREVCAAHNAVLNAKVAWIMVAGRFTIDPATTL